MIKSIIKSKYFPVMILAVINLTIAYFYIKIPFICWSDFLTYQNAVNFITGNEVISFDRLFARLLTMPLSLFIGFALGFGNLAKGFVIMNIIFYFAVIWIFYKLVFEIWKDKIAALASTMLLQSNFWFFSYGAAYLADLGGHFFFLSSSFFAVKYFSDNAWKKKFIEILRAAAWFLILPGIYHLWFYLKFDYTYVDWFMVPVEIDSETKSSFGLMVKVLGLLFFAGLPIFFIAFLQIKKYFKKQDYKIVLAMLPASLAFFAWPFFMQRTAFVLVPWLATCCGFGLSKIKSRHIIAIILILYIIINYNIEKLIKIINLPF